MFNQSRLRCNFSKICLAAKPSKLVTVNAINTFNKGLQPTKLNYSTITTISVTKRNVDMKGKVYSFSTLPEHKVVAMPSLSPTMESGSIAKWNVKEGEKFEAGASLCDVETDKATVSFDATDEGYLAKILIGSGDIKVGQPLMITVEEVAYVAAFKDFKLDGSASPAVSAAAPATPTPATATAAPAAAPAQQTNTSPSSTDRIFASPLAKKLIRESSTTLQHVHEAVGNGSGSNGRITAADVQKAATVPKSSVSTPQPTSVAAAPAPQAQKATSAPKAVAPAVSSSGVYSDFQLSDLAKQLAAAQTQSKHAVPHYYVSVEINLSELLKIRQQFNAKLVKEKKPTKDAKAPVEEDTGLSVLDFLVKAAGVALQQVPDVNASWMDSFIRRYDQVDINVIMGSGSLIATPVLKNIASKGLSTISQELSSYEKVLFSGNEEQVQALLGNQNKMAVGTFSIHNLGVYGVKSAAPIILNPQAGALALGAIVDTVIPRVKLTGAENEQDWEVAPIMVATLSVDHRVVDGAVSAQWLAAFKQLVENPMNLLL